MRNIGGTPTAKWISEHPCASPSFRNASIRAMRASEIQRIKRFCQFIHGLEALGLIH